MSDFKSHILIDVPLETTVTTTTHRNIKNMLNAVQNANTNCKDIYMIYIYPSSFFCTGWVFSFDDPFKCII